MHDRIDLPRERADEALRIVRQHLGNSCNPTMAGRMPAKGFGGFENWLMQTEAGQVILKVPKRKEAAAGKVRNLVAALNIAAAGGIPAPELIGSGRSDDCFDGRDYLLVRFVPGEDAEVVMPSLTEEERAGFFFELGRVIGRLHSIPIDRYSDDIGDENRRQTFHELLNDKLRRVAVRCGTKDGAGRYRIAALIERLAERLNAMPVAFAPAVIHGDLMARNILLRQKRFCRLLDFEHTKFFDPCCDFAKLRIEVFRPGTDDEERFFFGYAGAAALAGDAMERLDCYVGLELIIGCTFWKFIGEHRRLREYSAALERWAETSMR